MGISRERNSRTEQEQGRNCARIIYARHNFVPLAGIENKYNAEKRFIKKCNPIIKTVRINNYIKKRYEMNLSKNIIITITYLELLFIRGHFHKGGFMCRSD